MKIRLDFCWLFIDNIKAQLHWTSGVAVNMSPCHGEDRGFDSLLVRHDCGPVAQLVEQRTENPCVAGSTPAWATI